MKTGGTVMKIPYKTIRGRSFILYGTVAYFIFFFVVVISIAPLIWVLLSSLKTNAEILSSAFSMPSSFFLEGYKIASQIANIPMRFLTSIIVASCTTIISVILYALAAYALARFNFRLKGFVYGLLLTPLLIPSNSMIQPLYTIVKTFGLYDTKGGLILVYTGFSMVLCLFLMKNYFQTIPKELDEAAIIDGAGYLTLFIRIMLPIGKPALASSAILSFLGAWNELLYALLLTSREINRTLPLTMKYFTNMFTFNYTAMFAALVMCIAPTLLFYVVLQEQIMESMVAGSVKG